MFKKIIFIIFIGIIILIATSYFFFSKKTPQVPAEYQTAGQNEKIIHINGKRLTVEIADEPHEQGLGLSYRKSLDQERGMLFIFLQSNTPAFWMKDMQFALDMLWIDDSGTIIEITKNVSPDTYPQTFQPKLPIKYVLEVNAGWSDENKINPGNKITGL